MSSKHLYEELKMDVNFFEEIFLNDNEIYDLLKRSISSSKGIEEYFYPYIGSNIVKVLKKVDNKIIDNLIRIGSGKLSYEREEKIDFLLEVCNNNNKKSLGIELKIASDLNGLIFGYQSPQTIKNLNPEKLGEFFKDKIEKVKKCIPGAEGKRKITNSLITDFIKLANLIKDGLLEEGIVVGITKKPQKCQESNELEEWLKEEILNPTKEFMEENELGVPTHTDIKVREKNDLVLIWIYLEGK